MMNMKMRYDMKHQRYCEGFEIKRILSEHA